MKQPLPCSCPEDTSFEDFKEVYMTAWKTKCKGCTTFRPNDVTGSILSVDTKKEDKPKTDKITERPEKLTGTTYRKGGDVTFVIDELKAIFDPRGGSWIKSRGKQAYVPSVLTAIGDVIEQHFIEIGFMEDDETLGVSGALEISSIQYQWGHMPKVLPTLTCKRKWVFGV